MADVQWIKIVTDVFNNRKIKQIETMPDADSILVIWFKLLCLAGNINESGLLIITRDIPYTEETLSSEFNRPLNTVRLALDIFQKFGMIEIVDNILCVSNWEKYQNAETLNKIREQTRERVARHREKQKLLCGDGGNVTVTLRNAREKNREDKNIYYGLYKNVRLSDSDMEKLKSEFPDYQDRIERLSEYIASKGDKYKSHLATIRSWSRKEPKPQTNKELDKF